MSKVIDESLDKKEEGTTPKLDWKPNPAVVQKVKEEIIKGFTDARGVYNSDNKLTYPSPPTRFMDQYAKIGAFLRDRKATVKQLNVLNDLLIQEIKERKLDISKPPVRVLREVLEKELAGFGFQPKFGKVSDFLPASRFRETIRMGLLLKDPGANANSPHGDYTHAIQWWMIARQHQDTHFLAEKGLTPERTVIDIFKSLGAESAVFYSEKQSVAGLSITERSIWDKLVDAQGSPEYGFGTPEELNKFLYNGGVSDLLRTLTWERAQKRKNENEQLPKTPNPQPSKRTRYSLFSALPIQLPNSLLTDDSKISDLELNIEDRDDDPVIEPKTQQIEEIDIDYFDSLETKIYEGEYKEIIQKLSDMIGSPKLSESKLQISHYYLGRAYFHTNQIKLAEFHARTAFNLYPSYGQKNSKDFIPKDPIRKELGTYQHILRVTAVKLEPVSEPASPRLTIS